MQKLPADIIDKINAQFASSAERDEAITLLAGLWKESLNVGQEQLARSILVISEGNIAAMKKIFDSQFYGDPRDIIIQAEQKAGNPGHYFIDGF